VKGVTQEVEQVELPSGLQVIAGSKAPVILEGAPERFRILQASLTRRFGGDERESSIGSMADDSTRLAGLVDGATYDDASAVWALHSGGGRYDRPDWGPHDLDLAVRALDQFSAKARQLLQIGTAQPGRLFSSADLASKLDVPGSHGLAGVLSGFVLGCEEVDRAFPLRWFERPGGPTLYGVPPAVAQLFVEAFTHRGVEPIRARRDARWYSEVVPATVEILASRARQHERIRYKELTDAVRAAVPAARVPHRGLVIGWLLEDVARAVHKIDPTLPTLTSLVVGPDLLPSTGFLPLLRELRSGVDDGPLRDVAAREQRACAAAYSEQITIDLVERLRAVAGR
jgi:hypothetical protein